MGRSISGLAVNSAVDEMHTAVGDLAEGKHGAAALNSTRLLPPTRTCTPCLAAAGTHAPPPPGGCNACKQRRLKDCRLEWQEAARAHAMRCRWLWARWRCARRLAARSTACGIAASTGASAALCSCWWLHARTMKPPSQRATARRADAVAKHLARCASVARAALEG